jgi:hypothetical protein
MPLKRYEGVPEMLEQYMRESGEDERWVTVHELRDRFQLTRYQCTTVSGFLRRLKFGTFGRCPYIVTRIERPRTPADNRACRYLVTRLKGTFPAVGKEPELFLPANQKTTGRGVV